jgi:tetratricopeptide (TPR) repeat protein
MPLLEAIRTKGRNPDDRLWAAFEAAKVARFKLKDFPLAIENCRQVVLESRIGRDRGLRVDCQRLIADVALEHLQDYKLAIQENHRLLELTVEPKEISAARLALGKAYFFSDNFFQARVEADLAFAIAPSGPSAFEALRLKASALQGDHQFEEAASTIQRMIQLFPERARAENLTLMLAVLYEDQRDFSKALEVLRSLLDTYPDRAFLERRIRSLEQRRELLPGAKGLRK